MDTHPVPRDDDDDGDDKLPLYLKDIPPTENPPPDEIDQPDGQE